MDRCVSRREPVVYTITANTIIFPSVVAIFVDLEIFLVFQPPQKPPNHPRQQAQGPSSIKSSTEQSLPYPNSRLPFHNPPSPNKKPCNFLQVVGMEKSNNKKNYGLVDWKPKRLPRPLPGETGDQAIMAATRLLLSALRKWYFCIVSCFWILLFVPFVHGHHQLYRCSILYLSCVLSDFAYKVDMMLTCCEGGHVRANFLLRPPAFT